MLIVTWNNLTYLIASQLLRSTAHFICIFSFCLREFRQDHNRLGGRGHYLTSKCLHQSRCVMVWWVNWGFWDETLKPSSIWYMGLSLLPCKWSLIWGQPGLIQTISFFTIPAEKNKKRSKINLIPESNWIWNIFEGYFSFILVTKKVLPTTKFYNHNKDCWVHSTWYICVRIM